MTRRAGRITRHVALAALAAAAFLPLGGCAVSLFSKEEVKEAPADAGDDKRLDVLEKRMDAIEKAIPAR